MNIIEHFKEQVLAAAHRRGALRIRGGGTKDAYGHAIAGELLDTRVHRDITAYKPGELVITARAGTPLAEIEEVIAEHGQMLAFEPPHFGACATLGGVVAAGLSGPRRASAGAVRDFILGAQMMDGRGEVLGFGGKAVQSVAGYDVARLMAGALGTLGLLLEVSIKLMPRPQRETSLLLEIGEGAAIARLNAWSRQALPISASSWCGGALMVRLSGSNMAVGAARKAIGGELVTAGDMHWTALREQFHPFFAGDSPLWRLSVPSNTGPIDGIGAQLIEWEGAQRWVRGAADLDSAARLRSLVGKHGGHATLFRGGDKQAGVFQPLAPAFSRVHQRLKAAFDPHGVFNPGRLY